jgi:hypothetical protein
MDRVLLGDGGVHFDAAVGLVAPVHSVLAGAAAHDDDDEMVCVAWLLLAVIGVCWSWSWSGEIQLRLGCSVVLADQTGGWQVLSLIKKAFSLTYHFGPLKLS